MSRKNVWELLSSKKVDNYELELIELDIINFGKIYREFQVNFAANLGQKDIGELFVYISKLSTEQINSFLYLSEVLLSLSVYNSTRLGIYAYNFNKALVALANRVEYYLEKLNFDTLVDQKTEKVFIISKDTVSESVSLIFNDKNDIETSWRILTYKSISISLEEKIDTIRFLYTKLENINPSSKDLRYKNTKRLANYFRHHKDDYKLVLEIENNKEFYCDLAYDLMMEIFLTAYNDDLYNDHLEIIKKIR